MPIILSEKQVARIQREADIARFIWCRWCGICTTQDQPTGIFGTTMVCFYCTEARARREGVRFP